MEKKIEYVEPEIQVVSTSEYLLDAVIVMSGPTDDFSKENQLDFEESSEITPHQKSLWDE